MTVNITALWDALGWAILHSLWQGALIGIVVWGLRALIAPQQAHTRYLIGMAGLVTTFTAFLATFVILTANRIQSWSPSEFLGAPAPGVGSASELTVSVSVLPVQSLTGDLAAGLVPWLGMIWAVGFIFLSLQAYRAWGNTRWLATSGLRTPGIDWTQRFIALAERSGAPQRVRLFVSDHVKAPLTLGELRPIVLVPVGFLTSMPAAQVEAILLHELAHIRRHDFLFGLMQTAIKTVLYFNPTVLILSRMVDADREQACDDVAVSVTGRPVDLARGLAALRLGSSAPALTMAADGGPLLARLNRLMGRPIATSRSNTLSAAAISALMIGTAACSSVSLAQQPVETVTKDAEIELPETVVRSESRSESIFYTDEGEDSDTIFHTEASDGSKMIFRTDDGDTVFLNRVGMGDLPPMPPMPAMPSMPPMPATPAVPPVPPAPVPNFGDYDSDEAFEAAMEAWGESMEAWGEDMGARFEGEWEVKMEAWGEEVEKRFDDEWAEEMDAWGEEMEVWAEAMEKAGADMETITELSAEQLEGLSVIDLGNLDEGYVVIRENIERQKDQARRLGEEARRHKAQNERLQAQAERQVEQAERVREQAERAIKQAARDADRAERQVQREMERAERERARVIREVEVRAIKDAQHANHTRTHTITVSGDGDKKTVVISGEPLDVKQFRADLMSGLKHDGLIDRDATSATVKLKDGELSVNGKRATAKQAENYAALMKEAGLIVEGKIKVKVKPESMTLSLTNETGYGHTEITVGEFEHDAKK